VETRKQLARGGLKVLGEGPPAGLIKKGNKERILSYTAVLKKLKEGWWHIEEGLRDARQNPGAQKTTSAQPPAEAGNQTNVNEWRFHEWKR